MTTPAKQRAQAKRQKAWRQRAATGVRVLSVPVVEYELVNGLIVAGRLSTAEALDPAVLNREASSILHEWVKFWCERK